ncbi:ribonuclease P protein subunit p40-like [Anopheles arabiensis]|uniref:Uncharacterized protein n=1 Tax=Anopheles arabiensis TaxID=7173 RepID=A0A182I9Z2_ANOAR|nr:ribonuclease P protein subunit p40-like [Anopheles arabiensis]
MLCPEIWKFPTPACKITHIEKPNWCQKTCQQRTEILALLQPIRMISVVIPANKPNCLRELESNLSVNSSLLFRVRQLPLIELLKNEFVEAFVKRGTLYAVSTNINLESGGCLVITPQGELEMSLSRETYQMVKGNLDDSVISKRGDMVVIKLDLKSPKCREQLGHVNLAFDITLRWIPPKSTTTKENNVPDPQVHGSSIAEYLRAVCRLQVENVPDGYKKITRTEECIPLIDTRNPFKDGEQAYIRQDQLLEYIGVLALDCNAAPIEYVSSYRLDECKKKTDTVTILHRQGVITPEEADGSIMRLVELVGECDTIPWVGMHVQGFSYTPVDLIYRGDQGVSLNQDSAYTMVITKQSIFWSKCI